MNIRERVDKLLRLGESPNANEAEAALLKARELMAAYKLTLADLNKPSAQVVRKKTDIACSNTNNPWTVALASAIAPNYCCRSYVHNNKKTGVTYIGLTGFEEDVEITTRILRYAIGSIEHWIEDLRKQCSRLYTPEDMDHICNSYARGFARGVDVAYQKQTEAHKKDWGLVLSAPPEAQALIDSLRRAERATMKPALPNMYNQGFRDGVAFTPANKKGKISVH